MENGRIILLNGASSAGKTSIARALQNRLEMPYLYISVDAFLAMLPERYFGVDVPATDIGAQGFNWQTRFDERGKYYYVEAGPYGLRLLLDAMIPSIAAMALHGLNLIIDTLIPELSMLPSYLRLLRDDEVWYVQVFCPLEMLEQREIARGDRMVGMARGQYDIVHAHGLYDLTVDTSLLTPEQSAERIEAALQHPPTAFERLRARLLGDENS